MKPNHIHQGDNTERSADFGENINQMTKQTDDIDQQVVNLKRFKELQK